MYTRIVFIGIILICHLSGLLAQDAKIAAWNLGGIYAIPKEKLKKQAEGIAQFHPDLLLLSEVNPVSAITDLAQFLKDGHNLNYSPLIIDQAQTNNPHKVRALEEANIRVRERVPCEAEANGSRRNYLKTKRDKLGHLLNELD